MSETVLYRPGDCILLIGPAELLQKRQEAVHVAGLRTALFCTAPGDIERIAAGQRALAGSLAEVSGWMGAFSARMESNRGPVDLAPLSCHEDGHFDWVLDFTGGSRKAQTPGYYQLPADDFTAFKQAILEIVRRTRDGYEKPRYFSFEESLCAHSRQGIAGCSACLSVCAAGAISPGKEAVHIEANLCQGCGSCTLVCPTGAVRLLHPDVSERLAELNERLALPTHSTGVWIVRSEIANAAPAGWLALSTDKPASLGLEFWLAALAIGSRRIAIAYGDVPEAAQAALSDQIATAQSLLQGLGFAAAIGRAETPKELTGIPLLPERPQARLFKSDNKLALLNAALAALLGQTDTIEIPLPAGSPLGAVEIDRERCTLCAACLRVCPTGALAHPGATNQLAFTEASCVQCGLCVNVCPEKAVHLKPRLLVSPSARSTPKVIAEAMMFACAVCGKPFATQAMIARSRAMMADHPMFQGERARLMELCMDCRQQAMAGVDVS